MEFVARKSVNVTLNLSLCFFFYSLVSCSLYRIVAVVAHHVDFNLTLDQCDTSFLKDFEKLCTNPGKPITQRIIFDLTSASRKFQHHILVASSVDRLVFFFISHLHSHPPSVCSSTRLRSELSTQTCKMNIYSLEKSSPHNYSGFPSSHLPGWLSFEIKNKT